MLGSEMMKKELKEEETGAMEKVALDTVREERHVAPAHYTMKIDSFSLLSDMVAKSYLEQYESREFEASGYKWKLVLYPNGNKSRNGDGYISLYLVIADTTGFPPGWEINVIFNLFVYDQIQDKYLTIGDGRLRRFCAIKNQWGFPQVLPLNTFNNASNGYLIGDSCVFGAEVFVIKSEGKGEHFSMIKDPSDGTFTWEVEYFSALTEEFYYSQVYLAGGHGWKLQLCPKGHEKQRGKYLSLFLELDDCTKSHTGWKLFVEFTLRIKDQVQSEHHEETCHKKEKSSFSIQLGINSATAGDFTCNDVLAWDKKESCFYRLRLANCEIDARIREHFVTSTNEIIAISLLEVHHWFTASEIDWGLPSFISLTDIKNPSNNFIVNDTLIVEGVINRLSVLKDLA